MVRTVGRVLWIASVPLALTILLGARARATEPHATVHVGGADHGGHDLVLNPIQNFHDFWTYREAHEPPPFAGALTNFAVLVFLLGRFAGPSMARFVRERHDSIAKQLAESGRLRDEARRKLDEYNLKLAGMNQEIDRLISEIRTEAENDRRRILAEADQRAARMKRDAEQQIQAELQRVKLELERETVLRAVALAEQLIRERAGREEQRELADRFVKDLEGESRRTS
jgi:F-type H+-transporting ATPase subunit b